MGEKGKIDAVIVAAGSGRRLGCVQPKAFVPLGGKPLLSYSLKTFLGNRYIDNVILVVPESLLEHSKSSFKNDNSRVKVVPGGKERWHSVANGIGASSAQWVLVHDAARPFVTDQVIEQLIEKRSCYECAITATPEVDTVREFCGDKAGTTLDREKIIRVGTPQLFLRESLIDALNTASQMNPPPTDEAMLMQHLGKEVGIAWGDPINFKITTPSDLQIAEAIVARENTLQLGR
jgi:2-C-methyl-D-erythritol 4-phosphate cytidylyltransferase